MNNKNCGCQNGFVPVSGNWDFNMNRSAGRTSACRQESQKCCGSGETAYQRTGCGEVCQRCGRTRSECICGQQNAAREAVCERCGRVRSECICKAREQASCQAQAHAPACVMKTAEAGCGCTEKGVGIVHATKQCLGEIYDNARALKAGTLFPELHKPMNGYCPCGNTCGDDCQQAAFAAWDVRLYLDTHPDDAHARALLGQLVGDCCEPNYATTFLPEACAGWAWTDDPWPWNNSGKCCR